MDKKRYLILALSVAVLVWVLSTPMVEIRKIKNCQGFLTSEHILPQEVEEFVPQWQEYVARGFASKVSEDFSQDLQKPEERLPLMVKWWFEKECIDPKRFYYIEQKLRSILKVLELEEHAKKVSEIIAQERASQKNKEDQQWYENIKAQQMELAKIEGLSKEELRLVRGREHMFRQLLR